MQAFVYVLSQDSTGRPARRRVPILPCRRALPQPAACPVAANVRGGGEGGTKEGAWKGGRMGAREPAREGREQGARSRHTGRQASRQSNRSVDKACMCCPYSFRTEKGERERARATEWKKVESLCILCSTRQVARNVCNGVCLSCP